LPKEGRIATKQYPTPDTSKSSLPKNRDRYHGITDYYPVRKLVYHNSNGLFY